MTLDAVEASAGLPARAVEHVEPVRPGRDRGAGSPRCPRHKKTRRESAGGRRWDETPGRKIGDCRSDVLAFRPDLKFRAV
jgi:hypothetical protein